MGTDLLVAVNPNILGADPTSEEALMKNLAAQPQQLWISEEWGGSFLATTRDPSSYRHALRGALTKWYDGRSENRKDAKGKEYNVVEPRLSLLTGSTPSHLEQFTTQNDWMNGFLNRKIFMMGESQRSFNSPQLDTTASTRREFLLRTLTEAFQCVDPSQCVGIEDIARDRLYDWLQLDKERSDVLTDVHKAALKRTRMHVSKVATVIGWDCGGARSSQPWKVSIAIINFAIAVAEFHRRTVTNIIDNIAQNRDMCDLRNLYRSLSPEEYRHPGECYRVAGMLKRRFDAVMETAVAEGRVAVQSQNGQQFYKLIEDGEPEKYDPHLVVTVPPITEAPVRLVVDNTQYIQPPEAHSKDAMALHMHTRGFEYD